MKTQLHSSIAKMNVLSIDMVAPNDHVLLKAELGKFKSAAEVVALASQTWENNPDFAVFPIDTHGRVMAVKYHGIEIALLFKRHLVQLDVIHCTPAMKAKDRDDAWILIDLLKEVEPQSATQEIGKQLNALKAQLRGKESLLASLQVELDAKSELIDSLALKLESAKDLKRKSQVAKPVPKKEAKKCDTAKVSKSKKQSEGKKTTTRRT